MKNVAYLVVAGLMLCATPAFADDMKDGMKEVHPHHHHRHMHHAYNHGYNNCEQRVDGDRTCYRYEHQMGERNGAHRLYVQEGQDLNSNRWIDGSPRATLPPHNARGNERPVVDADNGYWVQW